MKVSQAVDFHLQYHRANSNKNIQFGRNCFDHPYDLGGGSSFFERNNSYVHSDASG